MASHGWSKKTTLEFIRDYQTFPQLWDVASPLYRRFDLKVCAYRALVKKHKVKLSVIKDKIKSLRTVFRREQGKVARKLKDPTQSSAPEYRPLWYAYEAMSFLGSSARSTVDVVCKDDPQQRITVKNECLPSEQPDLDLHYECDNDEDTSEESQGSPDSHDEPPESTHKWRTQESNAKRVGAQSAAKRIKRHDPDHDSIQPLRISGILSAAKRIQQSAIDDEPVHSPDDSAGRCRTTVFDAASGAPASLDGPRDRFAVFGELVACKLRGLSNAHASLVTENLIHNIIFEAEMGKFDDSVPIFSLSFTN